MQRINIMGVEVVNETAGEITRQLVQLAEAPFDRCHTVYFLNAHGANLSFRDPTYAQALDNATWILNDGIGVDIAAWLQGRSFKANLNGSDLINEGEFLLLCAERRLRVFLLGARQTVLELAVEYYLQAFPGLLIAGTHHGYFDHQTESASRYIVDRINDSGADILLAGLGNPLQEHWIDAHRTRLYCKLAIGFGASLDQVAGVRPRAPKSWIRMRAEWVYRLLQEPRRLWRRYLFGNNVFLWRAVFRRKGLCAGPDA